MEEQIIKKEINESTISQETRLSSRKHINYYPLIFCFIILFLMNIFLKGKIYNIYLSILVVLGTLIIYLKPESYKDLFTSKTSENHFYLDLIGGIFLFFYVMLIIIGSLASGSGSMLLIAIFAPILALILFIFFIIKIIIHVRNKENIKK